MKTVKRPIESLGFTSHNNFKFFNQMKFNGIIQDHNIFDVDQMSQFDVSNVYIDANNSLVSRDPLQEEIIPGVIPDGNDLVQVLSAGQYTIYVSKPLNGTLFTIVIAGPMTTYPKITGVTSYQLSIVEHYIICFNNVEAKIFDINDPALEWQNFNKFVEIPVIKRFVGNTVETFPGNDFTGSYKTQYLWSNQSRPDFPVGLTPEKVSINDKTDVTITDLSFLPEYRLFKSSNVVMEPDDLLTAAKNIVCIARKTYCLLSYTRGSIFERVVYPDYGTWLNIASVSKDGLYFFFVASDAVYRYTLGDKTWEKILHHDGQDQTTLGNLRGINNICCFLTGDIFTFVTIDPERGEYRLFVKSPTLFLSDLKWKNKLDSVRRYAHGWRFSETFNAKLKGSLQLVIQIFDETRSFVCFLTGGDEIGGWSTQLLFLINKKTEETGPDLAVYYYDSGSDLNLLNLAYIREVRYDDASRRVSIDFTAIYLNTSTHDKTLSFSTMVLSTTGVVSSSRKMTDITGETVSLPLPIGFIQKDLILERGDTDLIYTNRGKICVAPDPAQITYIFTVDDKVYIQTNKTLYTNQLSDTDFIMVTYLYLAADDKFTKVPAVSYYDTNLYLAFDNLLQITQNTRKDLKINFNLPAINNQSFISKINGIVNISTTEVALFFDNQIIICSRVEDELLGQRYDYHNTKLSTGIRPGDSVINTLTGAQTIFPTRRGLAVMSYQAYMATTDQILDFLTDQVKELWADFYEVSSRIRITQLKYYLCLTNGSDTILIFDFRSSSWWKWKLPIMIDDLVTDQVYLKVIRKRLFSFRSHSDYVDFPVTTESSKIDWFVKSQPLHLSAPNHYKNIKQLIFQLLDTSSTAQTLTAQIKLYRRKVLIREPEVVSFEIDQLGTFIKRFNYWKINELQWALANDPETITPAQLKLNGLTVKYEIGEEVR